MDDYLILQRAIVRYPKLYKILKAFLNIKVHELLFSRNRCKQTDLITNQDSFDSVKRKVLQPIVSSQLKSRIPCNFHHCFDQFSAQHGYTSREVECNPFEYMCKCKEGYKEDMGECRKCEYNPTLQTLNTILSTFF